MSLAMKAGLSPQFSSPPARSSDAVEMITDEAALTVGPGRDLRIKLLAKEGDRVPQGAPIAQLRDQADIRLVAPMPATVAAIRLKPGSRLSEIRLFHEAGGDRFRHEVKSDSVLSNEDALRLALQHSGLWPLFRRRPFGGMPVQGERPVAIYVMAVDTRPLAPDPCDALSGRAAEFGLGLDALGVLTEGPVYVAQPSGTELVERGRAGGRARSLTVGPRHPMGLAGFQIHHNTEISEERPAWDIHAEDVAAIGALIKTGYLPATRLVHVAGSALRESRLIRTQLGADLRGLVHGIARPGNHVIFSGSALCGNEAHWLAARDRQVTVLPRVRAPSELHWFRSALSRSSLPAPVIPTVALDQAFGASLPATALVRSLCAGDDETALRLGALALLEEDVALADYVLGGKVDLAGHLRRFLDRTAAEVAS